MLISIFTFGQEVQTYAVMWKNVEKNQNQGLPKSSLEIVDKIYKKAKVENNIGELTKALIHQMSIVTEYQEDFIVKALDRLDKEIAESKAPQTQLLHSMKAQLLWAYYQNNRYQFMNRSETVDYYNKDIRTWDLRKIVESVFYHFRQSLTQAELLKKTDLKIYDQIISNSIKKNRSYRPTLYDFIAFRALDFFAGQEPQILKPVETFYLNDPAYFSEASNFINLKITTPDSLAVKFDAIKLYQSLIAFHINDANPLAFVDAELFRLKFVKNNGTFEDRDSIYLVRLENLYKKFENNAVSADIGFELADFFNARSLKYNSLYSPDNQYDKVAAMKYINEVILKYPDSEGANNCKWLKYQIELQELSISVEEVNLPNKPFRAFVSYKNTNQITFRLIRISASEYDKLSIKYYGEDMIKQLSALSFIKTWYIDVPNDKDYQNHSVEIPMPELEIGHYIILASNDKAFNTNTDVIVKGRFWVSNLSYITRDLKNGDVQVAVYNRDLGTPLEGATVVAEEYKYNYTSRKYEYTVYARLKTDLDGLCLIKSPNNAKYSRNLRLTIQNGKDILSDNQNIYQYYRDTLVKPIIQTSFFTDRAIYRPGQQVYFKGIMIEYKGKESKLLTNKKTTVKFMDNNWQEVSKLDLITNEFGSFSGSFTAPTGLLNGQMVINNESGTKYFRVEEYKRPKFEVKCLPITGSYRLNEMVTVVGNAKAYAGNAIDGAAVKYRVMRRASFPWWRWWWGSMPGSSEMEIVNGDLITDESGNFEVKFKAIPDFTYKKSTQPVFTYTVYADVTDINGETHSTNNTVSVGYVSMYASESIPTQISQNQKPVKYDIRTTNLNGQLDAAKISVQIYRLKQPEVYYNNRFWQQPDKNFLTEVEYRKIFPNDMYANETQKESWGKLEKVYDKIHNTATDTIIVFDNIKDWTAGDYIVEIKGKDNFGVEFSKTSMFNVVNSDSKVNSKYESISVLTDSRLLKPGDQAQIVLSTKMKNANVLFEIEKEGKIISKKWLHLNNEQQIINIPINPEDLGGFKCNFVLLSQNRAYVTTAFVSVPDYSKSLDITFETFRDKLSPGQQEEWRIKIKGKTGDKLVAELLAGMYDASLDAFVSHYWDFYPVKGDYSSLYWQTGYTYNSVSTEKYFKGYSRLYRINKNYEMLNWFNFDFYGYGSGYGNSGYGRSTGVYRKSSMTKNSETESVDEEYESVPIMSKIAAGQASGDGDELLEQQVETKGESTLKDKTVSAGKSIDRREGGEDGLSFGPIKARTNFNETAFFMPQISTDEEGNAVIKFTVPESLTKWKVMGVAHTKDLKFGSFNKELVTQKDLMLFPNAPRFFRDGDKMVFSVKISNISDKDLNGSSKLEFFDALTMKPINDLMKVNMPEKPFSCKKGQSTSVEWEAEVPSGIMAITYRVVAASGVFTDGEENTVPVLTNRMLVTESMPLPINGNQKKTFVFEKMKNNKSNTLKNFKYTLEFTSNPAWYAVQALPYLMEYPYDCAEQTFSRFYANAIASHIANSSPKIKAVFESWKNITPDALLSNLEKNQELKSLMLEETPWVLDAKSETNQKRRIGLLFDLVKMSNEYTTTLDKLQKMQTSNGGWPWFKGMPDNRYITQYIVTGFGHLIHLGILDMSTSKKYNLMITNAVRYLDNRIREDYQDLIRYKVSMSLDNLGGFQIQYLYARSYFTSSIEISSANKEAYNYYLNQSKKYWLNKGIYLQGMIALANHRVKDVKTASAIMKSLNEKSLYSEEMGMYWANEGAGYYWYEAPIERQALFIEAFDEITKNDSVVEKMKIWLLKQKQTQNWTNTKATVEAIYALLLRGTDLLADDKLVEIKVGDKVIDPKTLDGVQVEAGTGYFKTSWSGTEITPDMSQIELNKTTKGVAWGAVYWQYFENLDKITPASTPLTLKKEIFIVEMTPKGNVIRPVVTGGKIKIGDKIKVRIEIRVDRDMEYVHMKDMRAAGFEPTNVLSQYKYQDGLGYYESTRDAATNFFFDYLRKGTYVFEYELVANQKGNFSNGITTIQCMYAPEFTSHSEGIRVVIE